MNPIIEQYEIYRKIAIRLDLTSIGILLCLLFLVLVKRRKDTNKYNKAFIFNIGCALSFLVTEILSWALVFHPEHFVIYKIFVYLSYITIWLVPLGMFYLIYTLVEERANFNKIGKNVFFSSFIVMPIIMLIPLLTGNLVRFDSTICFSEVLSEYNIFFIIESGLIILGLLLGIFHARKIGVGDTIVVILYLSTCLIAALSSYWWGTTVSVLLSCLSLIIIYGLTYQNILDESEKKALENKDKYEKTKVKLLLSQIQPHFLYNTLTTLKYLCETDPMKASSLCDNFSDYLRSNIDAAEDDGLVPFEKELTNINNYINIEKARFGKRVNLELDLETTEFVIPVLSIQTIIENAVKRGICKRKEGGTIKLSTKVIDNNIQIIVEDNGVGFDINQIQNDGKSHVGIENTTKRISLIGGELKIESEIGVGTKVTITIPKEEY